VQEVTHGKIYTVIQTDTRYTFDSARYTVFIPASTVTIQGVFVHQHGCGMEGRGIATAFDLQYQAFAKKWDLAIVGPDLYSAKGNCRDWRDAASGSGAALIKTLEEIGRISGHRELANLPWLLWGHSGGGYWALSMLKQYPERILALFGYSPSVQPGSYPSAALSVPVLLRHAGSIGDACCWQSSINEFHKLRSAGGYAGIAYTPYQSHNYSYVRYMAIPFYEAILQQRLPAKPVGGYTAMRAMDRSKAWLGDTVRYNIYPQHSFPGNEVNAAWFPDSVTAARWREYVITGTIIDHTPPPAPYDVQVLQTPSDSIMLTWKADADIESGISHFNIYKNDRFIGRFPATGRYQQFDTNGDDAYPLEVPAMKLKVPAFRNEPRKISVSTVNLFGLESALTAFP
jgi:pimeloyl-ACP methyl ester carboxylesterase